MSHRLLIIVCLTGNTLLISDTIGKKIFFTVFINIQTIFDLDLGLCLYISIDFSTVLNICLFLLLLIQIKTMNFENKFLIMTSIEFYYMILNI